MTRRHTNTWKAVELAIARLIPGATRRGADYRDKENGGGKSDLVKTGFSIEVKHGKTIKFSLIKAAVAQAEINREKPDDIPIAVLHKEGERYEDSVVAMKLSTFVEFFVNEPIDISVKSCIIEETNQTN